MSTSPEQGCTTVEESPPIKETAHKLLERGIMPVPVKPGAKIPIGEAWQAQRYSHPDIERVFVDKCNIGVMLGEPSGGLVDVDLDCPEAIELAPSYLPPTPATTGRRKNPDSHWWYFAPGLATRQHRDKADRSSIVELRSTGGQTLVGPSVHPDNDIYDPLDAEPASVPGPMLAACVQALADAVMAKRHGEHWEAKFQRPAPAPISRPAQIDESKITERAIAYTEALPPSISGQGGHNAAFTAATALVHGFALGESDALAILANHFNPRCDPPWSQRELEHKARQAANAQDHQKPRGHLRDAQRARESVDYGVDLSGFLATPSAEPGAVVITDEDEYRPFPVETLPEPMRSFVTETSHSIGCDQAFVALPLLSALGAAIGNTRRLAIKRDWLEPAIIWTGIVGESGTMKSPAITAALFATQQRQRDSFKDFEAKREAWAIEQEIYESKLAEWKKLAGKGKVSVEDRPVEPEIPVCERTWLADTTIEAMIAKLNENPRGLLLNRDELAGWINSMDRYAGGSGGESAMWLEVFGGREIRVDRKTSATLSVRSAFVSICGGIQPGILRTAMSKEHRDSGMLARFLLANPPRRPKKWREDELSNETEEQMAQIFDHLFGLKAQTAESGDPEPLNVSLTSLARRRVIDFVNRHGAEQAKTTGDLAAAYSKLECYCPRIALVFHQVRAAVDPAINGLVIDDESVAAAEQLVDWFTAETKRIYRWLGDNDAMSASHDRLALVNLISRRGGHISARDLQASNRKLYQKASAAKAALDDLAKAGMGEWEYLPIGPSGGRPSQIFRINGHETPAD